MRVGVQRHTDPTLIEYLETENVCLKKPVSLAK